MTQQPGLRKVFMTEFIAVTLWIATTLLVYVGTTTPLLRAVAPSLSSYAPMNVFLGILFGIMIVWEVFGLSFGSPFNPAVTLALAIAGEVPAYRVPVMWPGQFLGHVLGVHIVRILSPALFEGLSPGVFLPPAPHADLTFVKAVAFEAFVTGLLCMVALSLKHMFAHDAKITKFTVMNGLVIAVLAGGGEWTGSCTNPAMHFALSFLEGHWVSHSVYWLGPFLGAAVAGLSYNRMFGAKRIESIEKPILAREPTAEERVKTE